MVDVARVLTYIGIFALVLSTKAPRETQRLVSAVAAAIALITLLALASRLHPAWISGADQTADFLVDSRERLSYPLNYWNALGALIGIGMPLLLQLSAAAKTVAVRALSAAMLPALALTLFFTLSRGGIVAAAIGIVVFLAISDDRAPKLLTLAIAGAGGALLIAVAAGHDALRHGLTDSTARSQGDELLLIGLVVMAVVALLQAGIAFAIDSGKRPGWTHFSRTQTWVALGAVVLAVLVVGVAADAPHRIDNAVSEFKGGEEAGRGASRLGSFAGESRYALWRSAIDENATAPLIGTGSGTFEYWWDRDAAGTEAVRDAHSLYLQTLGEIGIVGLLLLVAFIVAVLGFGARAIFRAEVAARSALAAAFAGVVAFLITAAVDWSWQMPVLAATMLILAAAVLSADPPWESALTTLRRLPVRIGLALAALAAVILIAIPLASTTFVRSSESEVRDGDLAAALDDARTARNVQPYAATPRLQEALVLELLGDLPQAAAAASAASERESTNWRTWLVLSRLEAARGRVAPSVDAYREAKRLNPLSPLFEDRQG